MTSSQAKDVRIGDKLYYFNDSGSYKQVVQFRVSGIIIKANGYEFIEIDDRLKETRRHTSEVFFQASECISNKIKILHSWEKREEEEIGSARIIELHN